MKIFKTLGKILPAAMLALILFLTGCSNASKIQKAFVLSETEVTMMAGETKALTLDNPENKDVGDYTVAWMVEDGSVASVKDDGTVTAVAPGTTKITAVVRAKKTEVYFDCTLTVTQNITPLSSISFNASVYSLGEGQTADLNKEVIYYPANAANKTLTWTSSNPAIATVADGVVTPVSEGISTITASAGDGTITASCTVRVSEISVDPTGISFEEDEYNIYAGEKLVLDAKVNPENATGYSILWTSSDPSVATVSGGTVTAVREGNAIITARLNVDGGRMSAQCNITVDPAGEAVVPATKVQLNPSTMTIPDGADGPFKFGITIAPANHTDQPVWTTNRPDLLKIDSVTGEFTVIKAPSDSAASVLVTCSVGDLSSTAVVIINPRKPVLQIVGNETETVYDKAPMNTLELVAGYVGSEDLPEVTWASSNPAIATVDANGIVTAHAAGQCTVTAVSKADSSVSAKYTVKVQKSPYVSLHVGETVAINKDLIPEKVSSWQCPPLYLELNQTAMTVKGLKETVDRPVEISGYDNNGELKTIQVYILPKEQ